MADAYFYSANKYKHFWWGRIRSSDMLALASVGQVNPSQLNPKGGDVTYNRFRGILSALESQRIDAGSIVIHSPDADWAARSNGPVG